MLSVLTVIIYALIVIVAIILVALILIQPSKSGGFGSAFGGVGESVFGAQAMGHISKLTVWLIAIFFGLTLLLAIISGHANKGGDVSSLAEKAAQSAAAEKKEAPAVPAAAASEKKAEPAPVKAESVKAAASEKKAEPAKAPAPAKK